MHKRISALLAAGALFLSSSLFAASTTQAEADVEVAQREFSVVLIGDSYSAGNGTASEGSIDTNWIDGYDPRTTGDQYYYGPINAYRSRLNWAHNYVNWLNSQPGIHVTLQNFAWSGAQTTNADDWGSECRGKLEKDLPRSCGPKPLNLQVDDVPADTDLVMFSIGGNDIDFVGVVTNCFAFALNDARACSNSIEQAKAKFPSVMDKTTSILEKLDQKLPNDAQVVLMGYPLLSLDTSYVLEEKCVKTHFNPCKNVFTYDAAKGVRETGKLGQQLQAKLVTDWNKKHGDTLKVTYVNGVNEWFSKAPGHEPDPSWSSRNDYRWINEFLETAGHKGADGKTVSMAAVNQTEMISGIRSYTPGPGLDMNNWYHPNVIGHQEMAKILEQQVGTPDQYGIPATANTITATSGAIDIAFVIDTTGSMEDDIDAVRNNVRTIVADVQAKSAQARFALVTYRDFESETGDPTDYPGKINLSFTSDTDALKRELDSLEVMGGGDEPETVYSGLMASFDLPWQAGARKVAIVLGDAPPKDPEPVSGYTWSQVAHRAYEIDPVEVYGIDTGYLSSESFISLADQSGGVIYTLDTVEDIPAAITESVTTALNKPFAWIQGPYVAPVGTTLTLDARPSYAIVGDLVKYEWDFDGDGVYDQTTTSPEVDHQFNQVFDSVVGVRVTDLNGRTATGTTPVLITDDGDSTPRELDNCPDVANHGQTDYDQDGIGDVCDDTPGYVFDNDEGTTPPDEAAPPTQPTPPAQSIKIDTGGHAVRTGFPLAAVGSLVMGLVVLVIRRTVM